MRILFADDDDAFRLTLTEILRKMGYDDVQECKSENEAQDYINKYGQEIDIALLDMRMESEESGLYLIQLLTQRCPYVVSIVLTAYADFPNAAKCMEAGAFSYLPKPNTTELLQPMLQRAEERSRFLRSNYIVKLRDKIECSLSRWWCIRTISVLNDLNKDISNAGEQQESLVELLRNISQTFFDKISLQLPDNAAPRVKLGRLLPSEVDDPLKLIVNQPDKKGKAEIQTHMKNFPDILPLLLYLKELGVSSNVICTCYPEGRHGVIEFRIPGFQLEPAHISHLNALFTGDLPDSDNEAWLSGFALQITGLGAISIAKIDGQDTVITIKMPTV